MRTWSTVEPLRARNSDGSTATIERKLAPASVMRTIVASRNSAVGLPGRMPGTNDPPSWRFFAISFGWNIIDVQNTAKKKITAVYDSMNQYRAWVLQDISTHDH